MITGQAITRSDAVPSLLPGLQEPLNGIVLNERQVVPSAALDDIDFGAVRTFMRAQGLDTEGAPQPAREDDLRNASIADELDGVLRPTLYGLMVFGRDPQAYPHTLSLFVQCAAYGGADQAADVLSAGEGKGRLEDQVNRAMGWFRSLADERFIRDSTAGMFPRCRKVHFARRWSTRSSTGTTPSPDPRSCWKCSTTRIVVTSPGALPNHMTVEQARMGGAPRSRNEMMANAMVVRGLMERRGRGWLTMRHAMRRFNGTEPTLGQRRTQPVRAGDLPSGIGFGRERRINREWTAFTSERGEA